MSEENKDQLPKQSSEFPIQEYRLVPISEYEGSKEDDEIDLIELAKTIWAERTLIYKFVSVGIVLGVLVAVFSPKEYVSSATLMPEYSNDSQSGASSLLKQYGGLLGLGGRSYISSSNALRVEIYPNIVNSYEFQRKIANASFYFLAYDTTVALNEYYLNVREPSLLSTVSSFVFGIPAQIVGVFTTEENGIPSIPSQNISFVTLTEEEEKLLQFLRENVNARLDEETGFISVSARMEDPLVAAQVASFAIRELTNYLIDYRTKKLKTDLEYTKEQLVKAELRFEEAQINLAKFRDSNQGILTASARTEEQRLDSEYSIAFNLYNTLTQQYEVAKLELQEETPLFKTLEPVQVPLSDEVSGFNTLIMFTFLSLFGAIGWIVLRNFIKNLAA
jgi:uncharacterized protein involved in exopolysaccharide biosynthesis